MGNLSGKLWERQDDMGEQAGLHGAFAPPPWPVTPSRRVRLRHRIFRVCGGGGCRSGCGLALHLVPPNPAVRLCCTPG